MPAEGNCQLFSTATTPSMCVLSLHTMPAGQVAETWHNMHSQAAHLQTGSHPSCGMVTRMLAATPTPC
jgi:hypothetical protein